MLNSTGCLMMSLQNLCPHRQLCKTLCFLGILNSKTRLKNGFFHYLSPSYQNRPITKGYLSKNNAVYCYISAINLSKCSIRLMLTHIFN